MKKTIRFFAAALAIVAAASCSKEIAPDEAKSPAPAGDGFTFTATIASEPSTPETKIAVAADGKCTWTAGDIIIVYNGNNTTNVTSVNPADFNTGNIQTITVTGDMLSPDGKSLKITTTLPAPTDGKWYFYAVDKVTNIYMIRANGNAISGAVSETSQSAVPFTASASCASDAATVQFKHALAYLKLSGSAWLYKVKVYSNNGEAILKSCDIYPSDGHTVIRSDVKANEYMANVNAVAVNAPFYVALTPFTWTDGVSVDIYYGSNFSAEWAARTPTKTVSSSKSFTAVAGHVYDMGDLLVDRTPYPTYYERWEAGQDINIGGVNYNKATSGLTAMHITENTTLTDGSANYWNKILFVDEGAAITCGVTGSFRMNNTVIVGNKIGTRSAMVINQKFWINAQGTVPTLEMFKNMNILPTFDGDNLCWNRLNVKRFVLDDCFLSHKTKMGFSGAWKSSDYEDITIVNCDIKCSVDNNQLFYYSGASKLTIKNNVFFAPAGENHEISNLFQFGDKFAERADIGAISVDIEHNTFINLRGQGNAPAVLCQNYTAATVKDNLLIYTAGEGLPNNLFILGNSTKTALERPEIVATDNRIYDVATSTTNAFIGHWSYYLGGNFQSGWIRRNDPEFALPSNPYTVMDLNNGVFANTTSFGAKR